MSVVALNAAMWRFACVIYTFLSCVAQGADCPSGYSKADPSETACFRTFCDKTSLYEARKKCEADGAHLAKIDNDLQNKHVSQWVGCDTEWLWIGLTSEKTDEGCWAWDGYTHWGNYTAFARGQPANDGRDEDCVAMQFKVHEWHDWPCKEHPEGFHSFSCRKDVGTSGTESKCIFVATQESFLVRGSQECEVTHDHKCDTDCNYEGCREHEYWGCGGHRKCVYGDYDSRCEGNSGLGRDLGDGGWCYDERRDTECPRGVSEGEAECLHEEASGWIVAIIIATVLVLTLVIAGIVVCVICCICHNQSPTPALPPNQPHSVTPYATAAQAGMFQCQVPEGSSPGDTLQVRAPDGQMLQVQIPAGVQVGGTFAVTPPPPVLSATVMGMPVGNNVNATVVVATPVDPTGE